MNRFPWVDAKQAIKESLKNGVKPGAQKGYLTGYVAMYCNDHPDWSPILRPAMLRFIGGDLDRPYWTDGKAKMLENSSWSVKYFCEEKHFIPCEA